MLSAEEIAIKILGSVVRSQRAHRKLMLSPAHKEQSSVLSQPREDSGVVICHLYHCHEHFNPLVVALAEVLQPDDFALGQILEDYLHGRA